MENLLTWDDTFEIACALRESHPYVNMEDVSLTMIFQWTVDLPEFQDDPALVNDTILLAIYQEWFEEVNPI